MNDYSREEGALTWLTKKNTVKYILCGILVLACAVFTTMGVIAIVKEIAKDAKVRKEIESSVDAEYDVINYNSTNQTTDPNAEPFTLEDHRRGVLNEVPDYIANRGIILRGGEYRESGQTYRAGAHDTSHWWYCEYVTDCNLVIEGTDRLLRY